MPNAEYDKDAGHKIASVSYQVDMVNYHMSDKTSQLGRRFWPRPGLNGHPKMPQTMGGGEGTEDVFQI